MSEPVRPERLTHDAPRSAQSFWMTFALLFVVIAVLFSIDTVLARIDRDESRSEARRLFREGQRFAAEGNYLAAIGRLRSAEFLARGNRDYQLALGEALLGAGKPAEAEAAFAELLQGNANWGPAELAMARALARERRMAEAMTYYHRAIFGQWPDDSVNHRVSVRFELIDLLVAQDAKEELLAELLPLLDEAPTDLALRKRLGRWFLIAGSPGRAADVFQAIVRTSPQDAEARAGIGEAAFARGSYRTARREFQAALRLAPADTAIAARLTLVGQVLALDPTQRGLAPAERNERSRNLVRLALDGLVVCAGPTPTASVQNVIDSTRSRLAPSVRAARRREGYEADLDLAERLWRLRQDHCAPATSSATDPVALVLARLAQ
jgi:tetratricopeptide (TPR) repeat protein